MVQMDFLAANHVRIVGLCGQAHRAVIFAIAQLFLFELPSVDDELVWVGFKMDPCPTLRQTDRQTDGQTVAVMR